MQKNSDDSQVLESISENNELKSENKEKTVCKNGHDEERNWY